ncbi:MAG TPA: hypothetical protein PLU24_03310, partial [Candidatus Omnitrophota bacterium]|nr:hypothetical protein [Candidatus Omnitrophota bacterium]
ASIGYELIDVKKAGTCFLKLRYIEKAERNAYFWTFYFYRTKNSGWVLNAFYWNVDSAQIFL